LVAKNENKYISEFVNYYFRLGFNKIILFDNNDINGEKIEDPIQKYIKMHFIKLINYRGIFKPQKKAYNECYTKYNNKFDWIAFLDTDEFLYINNYKNINKFLSLKKFENCSNILINWKIYGDNEKLFSENKPVEKRFIKPFYFKNGNKSDFKYLYSAAKPIAKSKLNLRWKYFPHFLENEPSCYPDGNLVKNYFSPPHYSVAFIKHYATMSTEEFIIRLIRGTVNSNEEKNYYLKYRIKNYYFLINKRTKKKYELFKKKLNYTDFRV